MRIHNRLLITTAAVGLVAAVAAPAHAGSTWGTPQVMSSTSGRSVQMSDNGRVAVWIATPAADGVGPVRASRYRSPAKGWSASTLIPGASQVSKVQLSADGNFALMEVKGTGYLVAQRTGTVWGSAQTLVSGTQVAGAQMSRDARVVAWVDWTGSQTTPVVIGGKVQSMVRADNGTWSAPVTVGTVLPGPVSQDPVRLALSRNGSTLVWLDETSKLHSARLLSGVWQAPDTVAQINPAFEGLHYLAVERDGNDVLWIASGDDYLYMSEYVAGWQPAQVVSSAKPTVIASAPNARTIAFADSDGYFDLMFRTSTAWTTPVQRVLRGPVQIAAANAAVATTVKRNSKSVLRAWVYSKGQWQAPVKLSTKAQRPALSADGKTLVWVSGNRIYAAKR